MTVFVNVTLLSMSKLCLIFFPYILTTFYNPHVKCGFINTGTVLFNANDVHRQCWNPEEIAVLTTRMILQDLLPDVNIIEINDNDYVDDTVEYFRLLIEVVHNSTEGRSRHITMIALTDLIGGYLQHAVLPLARYAYYAGVIEYSAMEKLIQLYEELKWFLRTNAQGWAAPIQPKVEYEIQPLEDSSECGQSNKSCCRNLIYYQHSQKKRATDHDASSSVYFPMPFLDSRVRPSAVAVPFKKFALRNIESKKASCIILKYYISALSCLNNLHADKNTIDTFKNNFYTWIEKNVVPKLKDDKFYSGFGGILRLEHTLKEQGISGEKQTEECTDEGDQEVGGVPGGETSSRSSILLISMLVIIFIWFIVGTLFICYRMRANSKKVLTKATGGGTTDTSSSFGSSKWSSSRRTDDTCKCCTTATEKSTEANSGSISSEFDILDDPKTRKKSDKSTTNNFAFLAKPKRPFNTCLCDEPATIEAKHSMKVLPSIPEISEHSSSRRDDRKTSKSRKISFELGKPLASSSKQDLRQTKVGNASGMRVCVPKMTDVDISVCPHYDEKATSLSSSRSKSTDGRDLGTQMTDPRINERFQKSRLGVNDERDTSGENTTGETTDNTAVTTNSPHIYACHSSLTGNYTTDQRFQSDKPFIFGYDFQTSTSSELSDEESDAKTSTTK